MTGREWLGRAMQKPLRLYIPHLLDIVLVRDARQIEWLNQQPDLTRSINPQRSWLHRILHQRLLIDLRMPDGSVLPAFLTREDPNRAERQRQLEDRFDRMRGAPGVERDEIAAFVAGAAGPTASPEIGVSVQQWCGRLFTPDYHSSVPAFEAGKLLADWMSAPPWRTLAARLSGRLGHAKQQVFDAAQGDPYCVHATTVGTRHITRAVHNLRRAAQRPDKRALAPDDILRECLVVPPALVRACSGQLVVPFLERPLTESSLVVFLTAQAYRDTGDVDTAFMAEGWSACPARNVVPEMLRAVWHVAQRDATAHKSRLGRIGELSRFWSRDLA